MVSCSYINSYFAQAMLGLNQFKIFPDKFLDQTPLKDQSKNQVNMSQKDLDSFFKKLREER